MKNIVLVGFMGAGKTTTGKLLQERASCYRLADFTVDTNRLTPDVVADKIIAFMLA